MWKEIVKDSVGNFVPDPTGGLVHPEDKVEMALDIADAGVQFLTREKSLNDAGLQAMNVGCRAVDRTLDRTLGAAERAVGTVCDAVSFFRFW